MPDSLLPVAPTGLDTLLNRASVPARMLRGPAPDAAALRLAVGAALRAPDHGGLQPWRFVFIEGESRHALGGLVAASCARRVPEASPDEPRRVKYRPALWNSNRLPSLPGQALLLRRVPMGSNHSDC